MIGALGGLSIVLVALWRKNVASNFWLITLRVPLRLKDRLVIMTFMSWRLVSDPFDPFPNGFDLSVDALEAGLKFFFYPLLVSCLRHLGLSSQIVSNSWRYLVVFVRECRVAGIDLTLTLFLACFHLGKGRGSYYIISGSGFRVGGASLNNRGVEVSFFFLVSAFRGWGFSLKWTARDVGNSPPLLTKDEVKQVPEHPAKKTKVLVSKAPSDVTPSPTATTAPHKGAHAVAIPIKKVDSSLAEECSVAPKKAWATITQYKETLSFKLGLKKMGQVIYEYGYRVILAFFLVRYPQLEVEEGPDTILP
ncbi:hypothetical protein BHE74_00048601 [Ensete ventricosum]|nr:hypothetical protein BHE74_00048601 [Ensete ventricosum]